MTVVVVAVGGTEVVVDGALVKVVGVGISPDVIEGWM